MIDVIDITKKNDVTEEKINDAEEVEMKADFDDVNETYCNTCIHEKDCKNDCLGYEETTTDENHLSDVAKEIKSTNDIIDEKINDICKTFMDLGQTIGKAVEKKVDNNVTSKPEKKTKKFTIGFFGLVGLVVVSKAAVKIVEAVSANKKK